MNDVIIAGGGPAEGEPLDRDTIFIRPSTRQRSEGGIAAVVADRELLSAELERAISAT